MQTELAEKLSIQIKEQLPQFVRDNYETFQAFIEAYYEFLEQDGEAQYVIQNAKDYKDIDATIDSFVDKFLLEIAYDLPKTIFQNQVTGEVLTPLTPEEIVASKRAIAKRISQAYASKGSEAAIRFFFRALFDEEVQIDYPREYLLKPSDGRWQRLESIRGFVTDASKTFIGNEYAGRLVRGSSSGATAIVESTRTVTGVFFDREFYELFVDRTSINGTFIPGEEVYPVLGEGETQTTGNLTLTSIVNNIDIKDAGYGYAAGTALNVIDLADVGQGAQAYIKSVNDGGKITEVAMRYFGAEYSNSYIGSSVTLTPTYEVKEFSIGFEHSGLIDTSGNLFMWGRNNYGQLGTGNTTNYYSPIQIAGTWSNISCGYENTSAIKSDGTLWSWGRNNLGQLGIGSFNSRSSPTQVSGGGTWKYVAAGRFNTAGIKTTSNLFVWGSNGLGSVGNSLAGGGSILTPTEVRNGGSWNLVSVAKGTSSAVTSAIKSDGTLWSWGQGSGNVLGTGNVTNQSNPAQIGTLNAWAYVSVGSLNSAALDVSGNLYVWGDNAKSQFGLVNNATTPTYLSNNWSKVESGDLYTIAIKQDGTLWGAGLNSSSQLGDGTTTYKSSLQQIGVDQTWQNIAAYIKNTAASRSNKAVYLWGDNQYGQIGTGDNSPSIISTPDLLGVINTAFYPATPTLTKTGKYEANANIVLAYFSSGHGLIANDTINVSFTSGFANTLNGTYTVLGAPTNKRLTFQLANSAAVTGNITLNPRNANIFGYAGSVCSYQGQVEDATTYGQPDSDMRIQDSYYYQDYSYVIRSANSSSLWKDLIKKILHPAGMIIFSDVYKEAASQVTQGSAIPRVAPGSTFVYLLKILSQSLSAATYVTRTPVTNVVLSVAARPDNTLSWYPGSTYKTLEDFKFEYGLSSTENSNILLQGNLTIADTENLTIDYIEANLNKRLGFAPPNMVKLIITP